MSLMKKREMTEKQLASVRQNQRLSHGPVTAEGRQRIRAAHLLHGFYAQAEEVALRTLGEDPAQFQELLEAFWEEWNPTGGLQEALVIDLARCTWLMNRADPSPRAAHAEDARVLLSGNPASHQPAAED